MAEQKKSPTVAVTVSNDSSELLNWTWLWGVPGALLSVPILVSIKVVCDHVENLSGVSELLRR